MIDRLLAAAVTVFCLLCITPTICCAADDPPEPALPAPADGNPNSSGNFNRGELKRRDFGFGDSPTPPPVREPIETVPPVGHHVHFTEIPTIICCTPRAVGVLDYALVAPGGQSFNYQIKANQAQVLKTSGWKIRYQGSPQTPPVVHALKKGRFYQFRRELQGWRLYLIP